MKTGRPAAGVRGPRELTAKLPVNPPNPTRSSLVHAGWHKIGFLQIDGLTMTVFIKVVLFTDTDGRAKFREESVALAEGSPQSMLSAVFPLGGYQLRHSPLGFRSQFHCTTTPQWVFILEGDMEIGLRGGVSRVFKPGEHFFSADVLPNGASFDATVHGHWSRQVGPDPLTTLFVRA